MTGPSSSWGDEVLGDYHHAAPLPGCIHSHRFPIGAGRPLSHRHPQGSPMPVPWVGGHNWVRWAAVLDTLAHRPDLTRSATHGLPKMLVHRALQYAVIPTCQVRTRARNRTWG